MPVWLKTCIGIIVVIILGVLGLLLFQMHTEVDNDYATIAQHWTKGGKFIDYSQDLGVKSDKDLNYYVNEEKQRVEIGYGYVQLIYSFDDLKEDEMIDKLAYIGLTYEVNKDGDDFKFYWKGKELERWYKSNIVG